MEPAKWFFAKHEDQPTTEVAIRRGIGEDVYIVLAGYDAATQNATYAVTVNPLVNWIWLGFGLLALGTGLALLPERALAFAAAKVPAGAATATTILLLVLLPGRGHRADAVSRFAATLRKQLEAEIMCTCGCRRPMNNCPMEPELPRARRAERQARRVPGRAGHEPRPGARSVRRRTTAARTILARADRQGLQSPRLGLAVPRRPRRRLRRRSSIALRWSRAADAETPSAAATADDAALRDPIGR